jgi:hypothetical protein
VSALERLADEFAPGAAGRSEDQDSHLGSIRIDLQV